ncbi:hypothetical protein Nepgr_017095 [Nepenthes gracilis]|uniref:Protein BIG GRAIN 1-like E n=1 Tax=Nepenthes gracilis TaxID=150966 RepID=A0AAD3XSS6_NEPGR|nr:hypothetical protein Nepgr_017095 [Nepenthes gracilis]
MSAGGGCSDPEKICRKWNHHRRNDSGELDVFEATGYYAGTNDSFGFSFKANANLCQKMEREEDRSSSGGRVSLDMPMIIRHHPLDHHQFHDQTKKQIKGKKLNKQPSSPGGRLATFLNSLFSQTVSKKKKSSTSKSSSAQSVKDCSEEESPGGRRGRRGSVSHFRTTTSSVVESKSMYSSSSTGFMTPPPANTPQKSCKDFGSYSHHKQVLTSLSKNSVSSGRNPMKTSEESNVNSTWLDEKFRFDDGVLEKSKDSSHGDEEEEKGFKKFVEVDDGGGGGSDSSSDLFELQLNREFGYCSSGLPVYEATHMDCIKRSGSAITNGII